MKITAIFFRLLSHENCKAVQGLSTYALFLAENSGSCSEKENSLEGFVNETDRDMATVNKLREDH